ncbi:MAG TPA: phosphatidate cytidylyltransferase [Chitinophagaceae bacterium]|nr:phosphatidate cytidylyltransferase [Chitinophagaceae bacterium]
MAFNWKTFQTRTLTAVVFAAVMLIGLLWNQWSFLVLFSIIHFGCWWEYFNLLEKIHNTTYHRYTRIGFMLMGYGIVLLFCSHTYAINDYQLYKNSPLPVSAAGFVMMGIGIFQTRQLKLKAFGSVALGLIYISLSCALMVSLYRTQIIETSQTFPFPNPPREVYHDITQPWIIPLIIISSIWINDTMAYIVGSLIGKTSLSKISPKKTWEGTMGGIILCTVVAGLIFSNVSVGNVIIEMFRLHSIQWYIIPAIVAIFGTLGDLLESKLKRMAGVKDSGNIMPGHGGFLDRFDSLLIAIPAVWLYIDFLTRTVEI